MCPFDASSSVNFLLSASALPSRMTVCWGVGGHLHLSALEIKLEAWVGFLNLEEITGRAVQFCGLFGGFLHIANAEKMIVP